MVAPSVVVGRRPAIGTIWMTVNDAPLLSSPLYGLRTWSVRRDQGIERLAGPQNDAVWPVAGAWLEATCAQHPEHTAPAPGCNCGIHALHPTRAAARRVLALRGAIPGIVETQGAVELHADGFRAERARPYALMVAPGRNARLVARLAAAHDAEVVEVDGPDAILAWCRERGLGLAPPVVAELLGSDRLTEAKRLTRRRRRAAALRIAAVAAVVALALGVGLLATGDPGDRELSGRGGPANVR
jgi:hypothetical protein